MSVPRYRADELRDEEPVAVAVAPDADDDGCWDWDSLEVVVARVTSRSALRSTPSTICEPEGWVA